MLSATGRKFLRGPRGTGFLYVSKEVLEQVEPPFLDLHAATWTSSGTTSCGRMRAALKPGRATWPASSASGLPWNTRWAGALRPSRSASSLGDPHARTLSTIPGVPVRDLGVRRCGIVTFTKKGWEPDDIEKALAARHIVVDTSRRVPRASTSLHEAWQAWSEPRSTTTTPKTKWRRCATPRTAYARLVEGSRIRAHNLDDVVVVIDDGDHTPLLKARTAGVGDAATEKVSESRSAPSVRAT